MKAAQQGVSTLVVVLVLLAVMALSAAYANRNLLVEQRVATRVLDHMLADEAAEQGVERVLALLNDGAIDAQCQPLATAGSSLRDRYLAVDTEGHWQARAASAAPLPITCDRRLDGAWSCQCPVDAPPDLQPDEGPKGLSVRIGFASRSSTPGTVDIRALGCAQASAGCLSVVAPGADGIAVERQSRIALLPAVRQAPTAAMTAVGTVDLGDGLTVANPDGTDGGLALLSGGAVTGDQRQLVGPAGSSAAPLLQDKALNDAGAEALVRRLFGMTLAALPRHPTLRTLHCSGDCTPALSALLAQGAQFVSVSGDMTVSSAAHFGSVAKPVVLLVDGNLHWQAGAQLFGLVFVRGHAHLQAPSPAHIQGALVVGGDVHAQAGMAIVHDAELLQHTVHAVGSFVRLSGGQWTPSP